MDFIDTLKQVASRVGRLKDQIQTEEATKTSLIMPFFQQVFGYDVFNPDEFVPEFTADVGIKKGEKVDYAVLLDGKPVILIEAKWCGEPLDKHDSQLFRYFGTTQAKFAILTNGIIYKFYTDLEEHNKMDLKPFLELDILNIKDLLVPELKRFCKSNFNVDEIFSSASELKYSNELRVYFAAQMKDPSDDFVRLMVSNIYDGRITQTILEKFKPIVKSAFNNYVSELMNDRITSALKTDTAKEPPTEAPLPATSEGTKKEKIITTDEELEAFGTIKGLLYNILDPKKLSYRDTENYFAVIFDGKVTKWICRLYLDGKKKIMVIPPAAEAPFDKETRYQMDSIDDLHELKEHLLASARRFATGADISGNG
ncbi:MAG: type I restriction enzyme HsdR N-terminal domain-containing protein [Spirochaetia bacterium]|jgi:hypothetical protein|nr:type I restriction enzyme HsdR N-terminal domain-containing protein [Spirochaetia bacterium]